MSNKKRQVSFVKEVYQSTDEEEGNWITIDHGPSASEYPMLNNSIETNYKDIFERNEKQNSPASWENMLSVLETKCEIDFSQLQLRSKLPRGYVTNEEIWRAQLWDIDVTVKKIKIPIEYKSSNNILSPELSQEVTLLKSLRHPNCVLFIGYTNLPQFTLVTEYMSRGNIRDILSCKNGTKFTGSQFFSVAISVARGLNYLHTLTKPIVHGNISSFNILCQENWEIKISDYGMKPLMNTNCPHYGGRIPWRAPEVELGKFPDKPSADVYSYGIVLWELVTGKIPYETWNDTKQLFRAVQRGLRPDIPPSCSMLFKELILDCWQEDAEKRPSFHQIIEKLKPYENISNNISKHLFTSNTSMEDYISNITDTQRCTELFSLDINQSISFQWSMYHDIGQKDAALNIIRKDINAEEYSSLLDGELVLTSNDGQIIWLSNFSCRENLREFKPINDRANTLHKLSQCSVTPIIMEITFSRKYMMRTKPTCALVITLKVNNEKLETTLQVFEDFVITSLKNEKSWCGAILLQESSTNTNTVYCFYTDERRLDRILRSGELHSQLSHFKRYLIDIPIISKKTVEEFTFLRANKPDIKLRKKLYGSLNFSRLSGKFSNSPPRRTSVPNGFPVRMEVKPTPSNPLQLEEITIESRKFLSLSQNTLVKKISNKFVSSNSFQDVNNTNENEKQIKILGEWKVVIMEQIDGTLTKRKLRVYFKQRHMEPMVLLQVSGTTITYHPCGTWSQTNGKTIFDGERAIIIPIHTITLVDQLHLPEKEILVVIESLTTKWVIFGFHKYQELIKVLVELNIPIFQHKVSQLTGK